jgi:hypothetical protein
MTIAIFRGVKTTLPLALKTVYGSHPLLYVLVSVLVFLSFWTFFNVLDQLLFFSPVLFFYVPADAVVGFMLTNVIAFLLGIVVSMNVYAIRNSRLKLDKSLFSGSLIGMASGVCASCSSVGFLVISAFGGAGIVATGFLTNYQIPLRLASIFMVVWALYSVSKRIAKSCILNGSSVNGKAK